jgi:hypothetical protein
MNLADMLSFADIGQLSRIANAYQCECDGHSKHELIQSILSRMNRKDIFEQKLEHLSMEDIRFMNTFLFDSREAFSLEELVARVKQTHFSEEQKKTLNPRETITKFKQMGWLFNGYSQHTKYLFQMPKDLKRRFSEVLSKRFNNLIIQTDEPNAYRDEQKIIVQDIQNFLHHVYHNSVPITVDGTMYKRNVHQILDTFAVQEETVTKGGWRFGYGRKFKEYPNRFSLIYDYCYFQGLIEEGKTELSLTEKGEQTVISQQKQDIREVYRFWVRLYKNAVPNIQSLIHWIDMLCRNWATVESAKSTLVSFIRPFYYDTPDSIIEQRIFQMMLHLGLIRMGELDGQGPVLKVSRFGSDVIHGIYVPEEDKIDIPIDKFDLNC